MLSVKPGAPQVLQLLPYKCALVRSGTVLVRYESVFEKNHT